MPSRPSDTKGQLDGRQVHKKAKVAGRPECENHNNHRIYPIPGQYARPTILLSEIPHGRLPRPPSTWLHHFKPTDGPQASASVDIQQPSVALPLYGLDQCRSHGHRGEIRRVDTVTGGRNYHSHFNQHPPLKRLPIPVNALESLAKAKAEVQAEQDRKRIKAERKTCEEEQARRGAEAGINNFNFQGPLPITTVNTGMPPKRKAKVPLGSLPRMVKKQRTESPLIVPGIPEEPLGISESKFPSVSASPGSSSTRVKSEATTSTIFGIPSSPSGSSSPISLSTPAETVGIASIIYDDCSAVPRWSNDDAGSEPAQGIKLDEVQSSCHTSRDDFSLTLSEGCSKLRHHDNNIGAQVQESAPATSKQDSSKPASPKVEDPEKSTPPLFRPAIPLNVYPPIWAMTRQEVCETFEWFRSYQGGVYFSNDIVKGYLLGGFGAKRDVLKHDGRLIISHGGGRAESVHADNGHYTLRPAEDQRSDDKSVRALLKTYRERRPIALVIDDRYALFPYDLSFKGVAYAVLGFYMIVRAWAEFEPDSTSGRRVIKYKFAFQWCEGQGVPWWSSESGKPETISFDENAPPKKMGQESDLKRESRTDAISRKCTRCGENSPQVYKEGWACLQPSCPRFWYKIKPVTEENKGPCITEFLDEELNYQEDFFTLQEPCPLPIGFETLRPPRVQQRDDGVTTSHAFTRGFHCHKCGRLSCRIDWQKWRCSTIGCDTTYIVQGKIREAKEFRSQSITDKYLTADIRDAAGIIRLPSRAFCDESGNLSGLIDTFELPYGRGYLHHIQPSSPFSKLDADEIFKTYQKEANDGSLVFKRWPMRSHKCRGALLTNYFSHNAGEPYHYVGGTDNTVPFDRAPSAVLKARALIQKRIYLAMGGRKAEFNEVLSAAYMENQKMAFHSDEEVGLGPLVAGLSLGSPAFMHFKLQRKHDKDRQQKGILMSFILRHGDIFVMDGLAVQKYYDHTVVPTNFRIAATARSIHAHIDPVTVETLLTMPHSFDPGEQ